MWALGVTMGLNLVIVVGLWLSGRLQAPGAHALLALTNGIGALMNAGLLYLGLVRQRILATGQALRGLLVRILVASAVMAAGLLWLGGDVASWLIAPKLTRILWLGGLVAGGVLVYFAVLWLLGVRLHQFRLQPPALSH
jgi:putative peptidoglycan lipid II flippase